MRGTWSIQEELIFHKNSLKLGPVAPRPASCVHRIILHRMSLTPFFHHFFSSHSTIIQPLLTGGEAVISHLKFLLS